MSTDRNAPDPSDVHPEHDAPTPANMDDWTDDQLDAYHEAKERALQEEGRTNRQDLAEDQQEVLDALEDPERDDTAEVEVGSATLEVKCYMSGEVERKFQRIQDHRDDPEAVTDTIIEVLAWMIVDDEFADPEVWEAYREENGTPRLMLAFVDVLEPYVEEVEQDKRIEKFRSR